MKDLILTPVPPFRLDFTAWALRRRATNAIDRWDGQVYRRVISIGKTVAEVSLIQMGTVRSPKIRISVIPALTKTKTSELILRIEKMFGIDTNLSEFYRIAADDERFRGIVKRFLGLKPPRFPTIFEALVNAVSCQQLSLDVGINLLNRLSAKYGPQFGTSTGFPTPSHLSGAKLDDLRQLGFSYRKAENLIAISKAAIAGELEDSLFEKMDDTGVSARLQKLHGIGRWSAEYVCLRGLGRYNIFPADDVGGQKNLQDWLNLQQRPGYEMINLMLNKWSGYKGLLYFHMLLERLSEKQYLAA